MPCGGRGVGGGGLAHKGHGQCHMASSTHPEAHRAINAKKGQPQPVESLLMIQWKVVVCHSVVEHMLCA